MEVAPLREKKRSLVLRLDSTLTINAQPVENRRQPFGLLTEKSARRGKGAPPQYKSQKTEASPQSTECLSAEAFRQRRRAAGRGAKGEFIRELEIRELALRLPLRRSLP
jgi:hypothetical protein